MKKLSKYLLFFAISPLLFLGCDDIEENLFRTFDDFTFVSLSGNSNTLTVQENAGSVNIPVSLSSPLDSDLQVSLVVTDSTAVTGVDFTFANTIVTIPAGQTSAMFVLNVIDDEVFNESKIFSVELNSSNPAVMAGLSGNAATFQKTVVIVNDDCPTNYDLWFGALSVEDVGYGSTPGSGGATPAGTCDILRVNNDLPGIGGATAAIYDVRLIPFSDGDTQGEAIVDRTLARAAAQTHATLGVLDAVYEASGFYDETTREITLEYTLLARNSQGTIVGSFYTGTNIIRVP
ncbi:hypothetical protein GV828_04200 [Flavobacterium sp. NST-5]|uniref:Calx-beta domain-containing protein n=1 Tax=Flavobacterium ichthyis TaxID=2698827 RepID=A0ABW9Z6C8_9FLAO|nr:Calx-beta domain-containing protein [Flavobacterium ichthyis]NBL64403.1 hypothetical protein [Flavobacterium ichthyis]